jgi:hypothetical protein
MCSVASALGGAASENGRLRHGDGTRGWGARRRRVLELPALTLSRSGFPPRFAGIDDVYENSRSGSQEISMFGTSVAARTSELDPPCCNLNGTSARRFGPTRSQEAPHRRRTT